MTAGTIDEAAGRPIRATWRDFPAEYIEALRRTQSAAIVRLGPMTWNDARFAQREFYRLVAVIRRNALAGDTEAAKLDTIARQLRPSCPRCTEPYDVTKHWFTLQANPIVKAMNAATPQPPSSPPLPTRWRS